MRDSFYTVYQLCKHISCEHDYDLHRDLHSSCKHLILNRRNNTSFQKHAQPARNSAFLVIWALFPSIHTGREGLKIAKVYPTHRQVSHRNSHQLLGYTYPRKMKFIQSGGCVKTNNQNLLSNVLHC